MSPGMNDTEWPEEDIVMARSDRDGQFDRKTVTLLTSVSYRFLAGYCQHDAM